MISRHLDGVHVNNTLDNLVWGTPKENMQDVVKHGRHPWANITHCVRGHAFEGENLRIKGNGRRACRTCERAYVRGQRARARAAASLAGQSVAS